MMAVAYIREKLLWRSMLLVAAVLLTAWFAVRSMPEAAILLGVAGAAAALLLLRAVAMLRDAKLICDNCILAVPAVRSTGQNAADAARQEAVVSTFGILLGGRVIKWGCDDRNGVNLHEIKIDCSHITLSFGTAAQRTAVKLPHGLTERSAVSEISRRLFYEIGIEAAIVGW